MNEAVLVVGHGHGPTGFARVLNGVIDHLPPGWQVHHLATDFFDSRQAGDDRRVLHPNRDPGDPRALGSFVQAIHEIRPALVFLLDEAWAGPRYLRALEDSPHRPRMVFYAAVDEAPSPALARELAGFDAVAVFTRYAREQLEGAGMRPRGLPLQVIGHGVDTARFAPLAWHGSLPDPEASRRLARRRLCASDGPAEDAFIVLNANRNQPNKRIDLSLEGFARFAADKPAGEVYLHLHMAVPEPAPEGMPLADRLGIRHRLLLTCRQPRHPHLSDEDLGLLYNACDIGLNTSEGEGWGLVAFEHGATAAAQVVPRHTACEELWEGHAWLLEPAAEAAPHLRGYRLPGGRGPGRTVTAEGVAAALEGLYRQPELRRQLALAAWRNAQRPELQWSEVARRVDALWRQVLALESQPLNETLPPGLHSE